MGTDDLSDVQQQNGHRVTEVVYVIKSNDTPSNQRRWCGTTQTGAHAVHGSSARPSSS